MIILTLSIFTSEAQVLCEESVSAEQVYSLLKESEAAFQKMDTEKFLDKRNEALDMLPCVNEPFTAGQIAQLHRIEVLQAFAKRDMASLGGHARAAKKANPEAPVVQGLVQSGHPLDVLSNFAVQEFSAPPVEVPKPKLGRIRVDGKDELLVPTDLPYVFQLVSPSGKVTQTTFVEIGDPIPSYPTWRGERLQLKLEPRLTIAAGSFAVAAVGTAALAYYQEQQFWNPATDDADLQLLQQRTNRLSASSLILGGTSAGLFLVAGVTGAW
jgi:hypothetical protein